MLVTPAATAYLLVKRLTAMMAVAAAIGGLSAIVGLYASYYLGIASGPAIVLCMHRVFAVAYVGRRTHRRREQCRARPVAAQSLASRVGRLRRAPRSSLPTIRAALPLR